MVYFVSDLHFGDPDVLEHRPFTSIEEMDETLLSNWEKTVGKEDDVYILGDLIVHNRNHDARYYLNRLTGHLHLIEGNHDHTFLSDETNRRYFDSIDSIKTIFAEGKEMMLCHYPLAEWNGQRRGVIHLYGHIHDFRNRSYQYMSQLSDAFNVGCMLMDYTPSTFERVVTYNMAFRKND